jgi:polysaccharide pyruvyl transferase WcaK-like protein
MEFPTGMEEKYQKIGLWGFYGFGNLGDAAIQDAVIQNIRIRLPLAKIYCFSLNPEDTEKRHGIESFPIARPFRKTRRPVDITGRLRSRLRDIKEELAFILKSYGILKDIDLLIASGGGIIDDEWGGPWGHPYTLFKWAVIAKVSKTRFLIFNVGASPIKSALSRFFFIKALSLANYRSYRDDRSKKFVGEMGYSEEDPVFPDPAFGLKVERMGGKKPQENSKPVVGINAIPYYSPYGGSWPIQDRAVYESYVSKIASFASWLIRNRYTIMFIPSQIRSDSGAIQDVLRIVNESTSLQFAGQIKQPSVLTVHDITTQLDQADIVVASRLHSIILSFLMHKPVLAVSYHIKINSVMENMGQMPYCFDIDNLDVDALLAGFRLLESNRFNIENLVEKKISHYKASLDLQYDILFNYTGAQR